VPDPFDHALSPGGSYVAAFFSHVGKFLSMSRRAKRETRYPHSGYDFVH